MGPFIPTHDPVADKLAEQHLEDVTDTNMALEAANKVNTFALQQYADDTIVLQKIQVEPPEQINSAFRDKIAAEHQSAGNMFRQVIPAWVGKLHGWIAYISVLRSIEARTPGTIPADELVIPAMPQEIVDYTKANSIPVTMP